jgi:DNA replication and repair protein RecF
VSLTVTDVSLVDFRNFSSSEFRLSEGMNILVGPNAVGKTNTIEALQLMTAGESFRRPRPNELVRQGCETAKIASHITGDGRVIDVSCTISERRRYFERNGKHVLPRDIAGTLMSVLFNPDDLLFVKGSASYRRQEIDAFASQANKGYAKLLSTYTRSIRQRNRLLKEEHVDLSLLDAWDESISVGAAALLTSRIRLFRRICDHLTEAYQNIADGEGLTCSYLCNLGIDPEGKDKAEIAELMRERLSEMRQDEIRRQQTLVGPHLDDIAFSIEGRDARSFASQGQQRSIVLAWKMAEVEVSRDVTGSEPLLLLDDVMSELDAQRREAISRLVIDGIQTVVTTTNLGYFTDDLLRDANVISFDR